MRIETVIVAIWLASMAAVLAGAAGVVHEWAKAGRPPYRGHHHKPAGPSRLRVLADSVLDTVGELAASWAVLKGEPSW